MGRRDINQRLSKEQPVTRKQLWKILDLGKKLGYEDLEPILARYYPNLDIDSEEGRVANLTKYEASELIRELTRRVKRR